MAINPDTLAAIRKKRGYSQKDLAAETRKIKHGAVSQKTISRIESGATDPASVRHNTTASLAKALKVDPGVLSSPPSDFRDESLRKRGYTPIKVLLPDDARTNFRWVLHHYYGIQFDDLVRAAPWMFTLLAEMSLAARRRRVAEAQDAFEEAWDRLSPHLGHGLSRIRFEDALGLEEASIRSRDIFGRKILEEDADSFDPETTNPFIAFLEETARSIGSDAIPAESLEGGYGDMPPWPIFEAWVKEMTGGDTWARFALENVNVGLNDMPDALKGAANAEARAAWLVSKIPPDVREHEEASRAKWAAMLKEVKL